MVMGRPVHFVDEDQEADKSAEDQLRQAAKHAGFKHIEFQFEPIAAALDYERHVGAEELAFVVDIGGGTRTSPSSAFLRIDAASRTGSPTFSPTRACTSAAPISTVASSSMPSFPISVSAPSSATRTWKPRRGGTRTSPRGSASTSSTITRSSPTSAGFAATCLSPEKLDRLLEVLENRKGHALLTAVEDVKIQLSSAKRIADGLAQARRHRADRHYAKQFEGAIADQIRQIHATIRTTLSQSNVTADAIGSVFLTGGSSRIPLLLATLRKAFANARIVEGDAFGSVATGLALEAHTRFGMVRV